MNWSADEVAEVPFGVTTVTSTVPEPAGLVAITEVEPIAIMVVPGEEPKLTPVTPVRFVPVIVTDVPPLVGPLFGEIEVTVGPLPGGGGGLPGYWKVAIALDGEVPAEVVTVTGTLPVGPDGANVITIPNREK